jgi:S1-C subfamily serine protease
MRSLRHIILVITLSLSLFGSDGIEESIVKIFTVSKTPNYVTPWNSTTRRSHASGAIIAGNRILTNAHVVANETFIEVKRYGKTKRYEAEVEFVSHQADLALLTVKDSSFFEGVTPLAFDGLPSIQQKVTVYGFPTGGTSLSVSTGVVSRVEHTRYVHSKEIFMAIQVDAAINPGSSGGPAISDGKIVGVVMQQIPKAQSIGYLVPVEVIKHFLEDVKDGKYDGFPHLGITTEMLRSRALRSVYKMDKDTTGVLVIDLSERSPAFNKLKKGDVLLSIDGNKIENDGTVEFRHHQYTSYKYYIDKKQLGDTITLGILRDGKKSQVKIKLNHVADDHLLVDTVAYDVMPRYFIYGGYVFAPLTRNRLMRSNASLAALRELASQWATDERDEVVILLKVLPAEINQGDHTFTLWTVDKVNHKKYRDFNDFLSIVHDFKGKYLVLEDKEGVMIAIDREEAEAVEKTILKRYSIKQSQRL